MINREVKDGVRSVPLNFGLVDSGEEFEYTITNSASLPFEGYTTSCGCVGNVFLTKSELKGTFPALYSDPPTEAFIVDGNLSKRAATNSNKYIDLVHNIVIENPINISEPFPVKEFSQAVTIYFEDGVSFKKINANGKVEDGINQDKAKVTIPMKAWIRRPVS